MTQLQAIRKFASDVAEHKVIIAKKRMENNWGMGVYPFDPNEMRMYIPSDLNYKPSENDYEFRRDFVTRYNPAQGFANVTLTILHEVGHFKTQYDGNVAITFLQNRKKVFRSQKEYMLQEDERRATDWAIQWLYDPEHRRLAKQFEKEYFGY